jgi:hypothetical protein
MNDFIGVLKFGKVFRALAGKQFRILLIIMILTNHVFAQQFRLGAIGGTTMSWVNFGDKDDKDNFRNRPRLGFQARAVIDFPLKDDYSFQTEVGISQRGRRLIFNGGEWENRATYQFADVAMSLRKSFQLRIATNVRGNWFVNIGPNISYWISGRGKFGLVDDPRSAYAVVFKTQPDGDFNKMFMNEVNRWLFGINFGLGFNAPITPTQKIFTELRFMSGHTFFGEKESAINNTLGFEDNLRANEKMVSLSVAYFFDFDLMKAKKGRSTKDKEIRRRRN